MARMRLSLVTGPINASVEIAQNGYVVAKRTRLGGRIYAHRVVVGAKKGFIVHHKDGNKLNNSPENLEVMTQSEHCRSHAPHLVRWGPPVSTTCLICGISGRLRRGYCNKHYQWMRKRSK
jgi:hypothetical protein